MIARARIWSRPAISKSLHISIDLMVEVICGSIGYLYYPLDMSGYLTSSLWRFTRTAEIATQKIFLRKLTSASIEILVRDNSGNVLKLVKLVSTPSSCFPVSVFVCAHRSQARL